MSGTGPRSLAADLRRMAPVWAIVFAGVAGTLLILRHTGRKYIERGLYEGGDACTVAGIRASAGGMLFAKLKHDAESKRRAATGADPAAAREDALGLMKGDPRLREAREHLAAAARLCPGYESLYLDLSEIALWEGERGLAHLLLGRYHLARGERAEARDEFTLAIEGLPDNPEPRIALASVLLDDGETSSARERVTQTGDLVAKSPEGLSVLARLASIDRRDEEALDLVVKGLRIEPSNARLVDQLRVLAQQLGDPARAGGIYAEVARLPGSHRAGMHHLAGIYFTQAGRHAEAEGELREAASLAPNNVGVLFDHAVSLWRIGRYDAARDVYNRARAVDLEQAVLLRRDSPVDPLARP